LAVKVKREEKEIIKITNVILNDTNLSTTVSMKRSCRELSIDMVFDEDTLKNNLITLFPCFTFHS